MVMMAVERLGASLAAQVGMIGPLSTIAHGHRGFWASRSRLWLAAGTLLVMAGIALFGRAGRGAPLNDKGA
jgi:hypothetical protein